MTCWKSCSVRKLRRLSEPVITSSGLIRRIAEKARPGLSDSQVADVLLDVLIFLVIDGPDDVERVVDVAAVRLQELQWDAGPQSSGQRAPNGGSDGP